MTAEREDLTAEIARVLGEHGPSGLVNSREGWVECECGDRLHLPGGLTFDGYAEMWEEERTARDAHLAAAIADLLAARDRRVRAEALREAAGDMQQMAVLRFDEFGPHDQRGAAIWDSAAWLTERIEADQ